MFPRTLLVVSLLGTLAPLCAAVCAAAESPRGSQFFEEQVRPLLADKCYKCHGRDKQQGGLRLDTKLAAETGGESGPALVPGDPGDSLIIDAINYRSFEMPPDGKLRDDQIAVLTRWIEMGASWPEHDVIPSTTANSITAADKEFWAFRPLRDPVVPAADDGGWSRNAIDRFIHRRLAAEGLAPAAEASRRTLIRRTTFDLTGLPPTPEEVSAFLRDDSPRAYESLIDRLIDSPRYGERWARHWLDLVRYAESHGHGNDQFRPDAFRYRDYVVQAFNRDVPYDRFVTEQLAGDEVAPGDPDALTATGLLRHWIYESNQRKVRLTREIILNDVTEVTADVFLGVGMSCARCHDHKFDPIPRRDYYRLQAFFAPLLARDDLPLLSPAELARREREQDQWESMTTDIRRQIDRLERPIRQTAVDRALRMMPQEIKDIYRKPRTANSPLELQLVALVEWQMRDDQKNPSRKMEGEVKEKWEDLNQQLARFDEYRPEPIPFAMAVTDIGPIAPGTVLPGDSTDAEIQPGFLSVLDTEPAQIEPPATGVNSTGRRTALAKWITSPENPLSTRVIVNRLWQYHFGRGLVSTPNDFGQLGERPSHPDLLDWLARRFVEDGWSCKKLHRLLMTSATYRQAALRETPEIADLKDPTNRWLWRMPIRRLDAEQMRDSMLAVSGELDSGMAGPSVDGSVPRRTIYTKVLRNTPDPLLRAFDAPDGFDSTPMRDVTTTPTQALMMINGDWTLARAKVWAGRLRMEEPTDVRQKVIRAFRLATGQEPQADLISRAVLFLQNQSERNQAADPSASAKLSEDKALVDFCHVLLNSNEFLYVD